MRRIANAVHLPKRVTRVRIPPSPSVPTGTGDPPLRFPVLALGLLLATGCATRTLTIETDPPGAEVILDRRPVGRSPVTVDVPYGGGHEVILLHADRAAGVVYRPMILHHDSTSWSFDVFPLDAVHELLGTGEHQVLRATLVPDTVLADYERDRPALLEGLRERAAALRQRAREHALDAPPRTPLEVEGEAPLPEPAP
jgi:hypothetical protein